MTPEVEQLIHDVLHGQADEQQLLRMSAWIAEHEDHAKAYCRVVMDERAIRASLERETSRSLDLLAESPDDSRAGSLLAELALAEASATTLEHGASQAPVLATMDCDSSGALTKQQYMSALSYVLRHSFTPKRLTMLATAAALLFGVVLTVVLLLGPDDGELMVQLPDQPESSTDGPSTPTQPIVATLTDERDAVWDRRPGQDLFAGQRLTLTQGFAEITTKRGAIAILEAPATIELLDNNNALHLHAGKLVGICETESSKGFVVRTPHMDITDLGTRFGVNIALDYGTQVSVFEGVVKISGVNSALSAQLEAGQSAGIRAGHDVPEAIAFKPGLFVADWRMVQSRPEIISKALYLNRAPASMRAGDLEDSRHLFVIPERLGVTITRQIDGLISEPGQYAGPFIGEGTVEPGQRVDSFLVHFDPLGVILDTELLDATATIRFDRPILGLITEYATLIETDAVLGAVGTAYEQGELPIDTGIKKRGRSIEPNTLDSLRISDDRLSLTIRLSANDSFDQVRVLVKAAQ